MIFVDQIKNYSLSSIKGRAKRYGCSWCHMWTDGDIEELHEFAEKIGMKRSWFQDKSLKHYDLTAARRALAIDNGAKECSLKEWMRKYIMV